MDLPDDIDGVFPANQARSRDARDRLLTAGEKVFAKLGYDAAHVSDIAQAANCSVGSFYRRFRDKEAFFKALHHRFTERNLDNGARFFALPEWKDQPTSAVVRTLIENTALIMKRNNGFFRALFQRTLAGSGADYWPRMRAGTQRQGELLAALMLSRGEGTDRADLAQDCVFILRSVDGAIVHRLLNDGPYMDDALRIVLESRCRAWRSPSSGFPTTGRRGAAQITPRRSDDRALVYGGGACVTCLATAALPHQGMVWIPSGDFAEGDTVYAEEGPVTKAGITGLWMDSHEVTNAEFALVRSDRLCDPGRGSESDATIHPGLPPDMLKPGAMVFFMPRKVDGMANIAQWWRYVPGANWRHPAGPASSIEGRENYPVVEVTHEDALAYARWKHRDLPSEAEWEWAARGGDPKAGDDHDQPKNANTWKGIFPVVDSGDDGFVGAGNPAVIRRMRLVSSTCSAMCRS